MIKEADPSDIINTKSALVPVTGDRAIAVSPSSQLFLAIIGCRKMGPKDKLGLALSICNNPSLVEKMVMYTRSHPELITNRETSAPATLEAIRAGFPDTIRMFRDGEVDLNSVLIQSPGFVARLKGERSMLEFLPVKTDIHDIELALRIMILAGQRREFTVGDYAQILDSHLAYGALVDEVEKYHVLGYEEEKLLVEGIGQGLLRARRYFEIHTEDMSEDPEKYHFTRSESDFQGILAQIRFLSMVIGVLNNSREKAGTTSDMVTRYKQFVQGLLDEVTTRYPQRFPEVSKMFDVSQRKNLDRWVETPGEPGFDNTEIKSNISHHGDD